jgi:hypothetical protein
LLELGRALGRDVYRGLQRAIVFDEVFHAGDECCVKLRSVRNIPAAPVMIIEYDCWLNLIQDIVKGLVFKQYPVHKGDIIHVFI